MSDSPAVKMARLSEEERAKILGTFSPEQIEALRHTWEFWARPEQLEPKDWLTWYIETGRGFGKTRTGCETTHKKVNAGHVRYGALVHRTAGDVREVLVEGESGLLATAQPGKLPKYEPSKRRLTWPNGAQFSTYSAEEPDQLRGPTHDFGMGDEFACVTGDSLVLMADGTSERIDCIEPGDVVMTRSGPRRVLDAWCSGVAPVFEITTADGLSLRCTQNHPFAVSEDQWVQAECLEPGSELVVCNLDATVAALSLKVVSSVQRGPMAQLVYDLHIEGTHEFIANGFVVHNTWKGITGVDGLTAFDNLRFSMRGTNNPAGPQLILMTTPKRVRSVKQLHEDAANPIYKIRITHGSLMDNIANLDQAYVASIMAKYAGTALGEQEIEGKLARTVEGAIFTELMFAASRILSTADLPALGQPVVAVDPSSGDGSGDECGITVQALSMGTLPTEFQQGGLVVVQNLRHGYVLEDASLSGPPDVWADKVCEVAAAHGATTVVAEGNQGHMMVSSLIKARNPSLRVVMVHARVGKEARAQPCAGLFAQKRWHLVGEFAELEDQCTTWVPGKGQGSPDRMDAMVWGQQHLEPHAVSAPVTTESAAQLQIPKVAASISSPGGELPRAAGMGRREW